MGRLAAALVLTALFVTSYLVVATEEVMSSSDGMAGVSGAVPLNLRQCKAPFEYCKVKPEGCGCHGSEEAMKYQKPTQSGEPVNVPVVDRISAKVVLNGNEEFWEYDPGRQYQVDVYVQTDRPPGRWNHAGFDLNVSGGRFVLIPGDTDVRLTGPGNYSHQGTKNTSVPRFQNQNYGAYVDDESRWAGELTNTAKGAEVPSIGGTYHWRARWISPSHQKPYGAAFVMAFLVPNGDGIDSCTYVIDSTGCNQTKGYSDQNNWDWWYFMVPRKIVCERGHYGSLVDCRKAVESFIIPPPPPLNTNGTAGNGGGDGGNEGIPALPVEGLLAAVALAAIWSRRGRSRNRPSDKTP